MEEEEARKDGKTRVETGSELDEGKEVNYAWTEMGKGRNDAKGGEKARKVEHMMLGDKCLAVCVPVQVLGEVEVRALYKLVKVTPN